MARLSARQRKTLSRNIRFHKERIFPGKGSGTQLASAMGVSPQLISFWTNNRRIPTDYELAKLSLLFDISIFTLCGLPKPKHKKGKNPAMDTIEMLVVKHNNTINKTKSSTIPKSKIIKVKSLIIQYVT